MGNKKKVITKRKCYECKLIAKSKPKDRNQTSSEPTEYLIISSSKLKLNLNFCYYDTKKDTLQ